MNTIPSIASSMLFCFLLLLRCFAIFQQYKKNDNMPIVRLNIASGRVKFIRLYNISAPKRMSEGKKPLASFC